MVNKSSIAKLQEIARENNAKIVVNEATDSKYVDCEIIKDDIRLYPILTNFGGTYFVYGLDSDIAPSELYLDLPTDDPKNLKKREDEIFNHIESFLRRKVVYHKSPSFLNKSRGYVELQVDGKSVKLSQKKNYFKLPEV